jgi:hypothetical protein
MGKVFMVMIPNRQSGNGTITAAATGNATTAKTGNKEY